jgi:hypothetical protein
MLSTEYGGSNPSMRYQIMRGMQAVKATGLITLSFGFVGSTPTLRYQIPLDLSSFQTYLSPNT